MAISFEEQLRRTKLEQIAKIREYGLREEEAVAALLRLLPDKDAQVRAEAASAVWDYYDVGRLIELTIKHAREDADPEVRIRATASLGRVLLEWRNHNLLSPSLAQDVRIFLFEQARPDNDMTERRYAIEALGFAGDHPELAPLIEELDGRVEKECLISALFAMGRSRDPRWHERILEHLRGFDEELRLQAAQAVGEARLTAAVEDLGRLARDDDPRMRATAATALGAIGADDAAGLLLELAAEDADESVRRAAQAALDEVVGSGAPEDEDDDHDDDDGDGDEAGGRDDDAW